MRRLIDQVIGTRRVRSRLGRRPDSMKNESARSRARHHRPLTFWGGSTIHLRAVGALLSEAEVTMTTDDSQERVAR